LKKIAVPIVVLAASAGYAYADRVWLNPPAEDIDATIEDLLLADMPMAAGSTFGELKDGKYPGPQSDAYYGYVEVQAVVKGGRLAQVVVVHAPKGSQTSQMLSSRSISKLKKQAVATQSAAVDIVTGATLTSKAFAQSLTGALASAHI
jgi:uncharacterized protein with FMN-binding domain